MDDTNELRRMAIHREVERQLNGQREELQETILQGCEETDSTEKVCAKMVVNGIIASAKIVADMVVSMLIDTGIVPPKSDDEIRKSLFSVVGQEKEQGGD